MMKPISIYARLLALAFVAAILAGVVGMPRFARATDAYDIHVILPLTGGGAFLGTGHRANLEALEAVVNDGDVHRTQVHFVFHDDQSSPQVAVQLANEVLALRPSVILGSSILAMCNAMAPLLKNGPVLYCLSPAFHPADSNYGFAVSTDSIDKIAALVRYFRLKGWSKFAVITATDATGQDGSKAIDRILALPENKDMKKVEHEHFNPTDVSVAAQMERIRASGAQAFIAWTTGAPLATILKGAVQAGLDIPVASGSGNQTFAEMAQYKDFLPKRLLIPSGLYPEHEGIFTLDPRVEKAQHEMYAVLAKRNLKSDNMTATSWDAGLIVVDALRKFGVSASADQIRQHIAGLNDFAGIGGIYDFKTYPERGLGAESAVVVRFDPQGQHWVWVSKPGGMSLEQ